ncbi:MAG: hypothetical protein IJD28_06430 [Deferribacterales bacterium]|nr:hypothetical protein [Deferribacterales bacterium]
MDIEIKGTNEIVLSGNIKSLKDYQNIKQTVTDMIAGGVDNIIIKTPESFSITSSVIGFFMKVIFQDHVKITLYVSDPRLFNILEDLQLIETFNVIRVS